MKLTTIKLDSIWTRGDVPEDAVELERDYPAIIVTAADADGQHELIDGYHRVGAARYSGLERIRAIVVDAATHARLETMDEAAWISEVAEFEYE